MKKFLLMLFFPYIAWSSVGHGLTFSMGWENIGLSPGTTWMPHYGIMHTQGSRKAMYTSLTYNILGKKRVYYSPTIGLTYQANWSLAGAMNTMQVDLGLAGLGVYMTRPIEDYPEDELKGSVFAVFDINFAKVSFGGNMTPNKGIFKGGKRKWDDANKQFGNQYYPFGEKYSYFKVGIPISIKFWGMVSSKVGLGFDLSSNVAVMELSLVRKSLQPALGYSIGLGLLITVF